MIFGNVWRPCR